MHLKHKLEKEPIHSAVLVLRESSTDSLVLTKRSEALSMHPGEISFPGGLWEACDLSFYDTALRELYEELGISPERIQPVREMNTEMTLYGTIIHPWLATIETIEPHKINTKEVSSIISIPFSLVTQRKYYKKISVQRNAITFNTIQFVAVDARIWGATARIMKQLVVSI